MTRRLIITYFTITAFALASLAIPLGITFAHREKDRLLFAVERDADAIAAQVQGAVTAGKKPPSAAILMYAARTGGHVIVVDKRGVALLDTGNLKGPARDFSSAARPEIVQALAGNSSDGIRHSDTLGTDLIYAAVPIAGNDGVKGAVRITYTSGTLSARIRRTWSQLALLCLLVLFLVMIVGWLLARSVTRPVRDLENAANRVARGDLETRVPEQSGPPELQHLVAAFNRMASEISRLLGAQQQFVADASHQLRTPLTALRLRLENLDARVASSEQSAIAAIIADVSRMSRLVDGLLVLARDDAARLAPEPTDVIAVVRTRGDAWRDAAADRGVQLAVEASVGAWANATPGALEQIVDNLLDNALSVSQPGNTVILRVASDGRRVDIHVIDEGPGLGYDERVRAFDRFWRAPDAPAGGSGLGLSIVRRLAEASGGTARLDGSPGGGIDAVITLVAARAAAPSPPAGRSAGDEATVPA